MAIRELDTDLYRTFTNYSAVTKSRLAHIKKPKDMELKRQLYVEENKIPIYPAVIILDRAKSFKYNTVRAYNKNK